jgi:hypothetical protein
MLIKTVTTKSFTNWEKPGKFHIDEPSAQITKTVCLECDKKRTSACKHHSNINNVNRDLSNDVLSDYVVDKLRRARESAVTRHKEIHG